MGRLARAVLNMRTPPKTDVEVQTGKEARQIVDVNSLPYFQKILKRLEAVAQQPVVVGQHATMIEQVGKQNAYREILGLLKKELETAERTLAMAQARQRGS